MTDTTDTTPAAGPPPGTRKTVDDIWIEVQREQVTFNRIIKWLVGLLIVAAVIAAGAAVLSILEFRNMRSAYVSAIANAQAQALIDRGEATRERQTIKNNQLAQADSAEFARREADLKRQVDRAVVDGTAEALVPRAVEAARGHAIGTRLHTVTEHLVASVLDEADAGRVALAEPDRVFLEAIKLDWTAPEGEAEPVLLAIAEDAESPHRAYAYSALSQLYYENADNDDLAGDDKCNLAITAGDRAIALGLDELGPYLWKGECRRKKGESAEGFRAFRAATAWVATNPEKAAQVSMDLVRRAHHGYGTTLVALVAADDVDEVEDALTDEDALAKAEAQLNLAADMRVARGEGAIGRVYTAENIGFIHLIRGDWPNALSHTAYVNEQLPLAWNLTVRHIAAKTAYYDAQANDELAIMPADDARTIACNAQTTLSLMQYNRFDEEELLRLVPKDFHGDVERLIGPAKAAEERKAREAEGLMLTAEAAPAALKYDSDEDICRSVNRLGWLLD